MIKTMLNHRYFVWINSGAFQLRMTIPIKTLTNLSIFLVALPIFVFPTICLIIGSRNSCKDRAIVVIVRRPNLKSASLVTPAAASG